MDRGGGVLREHHRGVTSGSRSVDCDGVVIGDGPVVNGDASVANDEADPRSRRLDSAVGIEGVDGEVWAPDGDYHGNVKGRREARLWNGPHAATVDVDYENSVVPVNPDRRLSEADVETLVAAVTPAEAATSTSQRVAPRRRMRRRPYLKRLTRRPSQFQAARVSHPSPRAHLDPFPTRLILDDRLVSSLLDQLRRRLRRLLQHLLRHPPPPVRDRRHANVAGR